MKKLVLVTLFICTIGVSSIGISADVDNYVGCIKQTSNWLFNNTGAEQQGAVMAATRLCIARPLGVSIELLHCVKETTIKLYKETMAQINSAAIASSEICLLN